MSLPRGGVNAVSSADPIRLGDSVDGGSGDGVDDGNSGFAGSADPVGGGRVPTAAGEAPGDDDGVPPPPAPHPETASARNKRDLIKEAVSTKHLLTHKPFNPHCQGCRIGKLKRKRTFEALLIGS